MNEIINKNIINTKELFIKNIDKEIPINYERYLILKLVKNVRYL